MRVFPTICVHMCSVSQVASHSRNGKAGQSVKVKFHLVDVAPPPLLAGLERFDDGVVRGMEMLSGVAVRRGVAAAHVPADHAQPQMHPAVAGLEAFLADRKSTRLN